MNIIKAFNDTIDYIESVLDKVDEEIDGKKVLYLSGYSYPMFSRLFSILTDMALSEYIRNRRLTEAAICLRETEEKIIDIAMIYGYESADAFRVAFKNFHGHTPSEVRKGHPFNVTSRIQLALNIRGGRSMNITIQKKDAFKVAGINKEGIDSSLCIEVWKDFFDKYTICDLEQLGKGTCVGVCHDIENPQKINYMAGYMIEDEIKARRMGLDILHIDDAEYAIVELEGPVPECIHEGWKYVMEVFLPEHGYQHSGAPDFEYYYPGDMYQSDYKMALWIPISKE